MIYEFTQPSLYFILGALSPILVLLLMGLNRDYRPVRFVFFKILFWSIIFSTLVYAIIGFLITNNLMGWIK